MLVRKNLKFFSVVKNSWFIILFSLSLSSVIWVCYEYFNLTLMSLPIAVDGILGTALAIFLGFRNNSAYDRWWEARKIWGQIVNDSRSFSRQISTFFNLIQEDFQIEENELKKIQRRLIFRHLAWVNVLRIQLRKENSFSDVSNYLCENEYDLMMLKTNKATDILHSQGNDINSLVTKKMLSEFRFLQLNEILNKCFDTQGKSERIKNTPLPRQYDYFTKIFLALFVIVLPFGMVEAFVNHGIGYMSVPTTVAISFVFYVIHKVGVVIEEPFENSISDIPLSAICRTIEIDLLEQLGEKNVPEQIKPIKGVLF